LGISANTRSTAKSQNVQSGFDEVPVGTVLVAKNFNWFLIDQYGECAKDKTSWLLNRAAKFSSTEFRKILIIVGNASEQNSGARNVNKEVRTSERERE